MMNNSLFKFFVSPNVGFYLLIVAILGDILIPFILAPFCNKYNHLTMVMSLLGNRNSPVYVYYNVWLVVAGLMLLCGNISLYKSYSNTSPLIAAWLFIVILIYAIGGCILSGLFSVGETKELLTVSAKIHGYGSVLGFFALTFAPLIIGILSIRSKHLAMGLISFVFFILAVLFFALFVMADKKAFAQTIIANEGLWQRLSLLCMYAPILIAAFKKVL